MLTGDGAGNDVAVLEGQLTWLAHIIGAVLRGRLSSSSDAQVGRPWTLNPRP